MNFFQDRQIRRYCLFLLLFSLLLFCFGGCFCLYQTNTAKNIYLAHDQALASALLQQVVSAPVVADALTSSPTTPEGTAPAQTYREALLEQMGKLACAKVNDAVKLAYLPEEERDAIGRLDLSALTEFRRSGAGTVEMKFSDRMRALERLLELSGPSGEEQLERFLQRMEEPEA